MDTTGQTGELRQPAELGKRIDRLIRRARLSRTKLANAVGARPVTLNKWLTTGSLPAWIVPALAKALGSSVDYLLSGTGDVIASSLQKQAKATRKHLTNAVIALQALERTAGVSA